jgi:hypothetical protein
MALIRCLDCDKEVISEATTYIHRGRSFKQKLTTNKNKGWIFVILETIIQWWNNKK